MIEQAAIVDSFHFVLPLSAVIRFLTIVVTLGTGKGKQTAVMAVKVVSET